MSSGIFWNEQGMVCADAKTESRTLVGGKKGQPLSQVPGWGAEGRRESQEQLAVCSKLTSRLIPSRPAGCPLCPAVPPVCRFHLQQGLGKQGSASVPGPKQRAELGGWGAQSGSKSRRPGGQEVHVRRPGCQEKERSRWGVYAHN